MRHLTSSTEVENFQKKFLPTLLPRVKLAQDCARKLGMEVVHCRIQSRTADGRDRTALHKRMQIHVPPGTAKWMVKDFFFFFWAGSHSTFFSNFNFIFNFSFIFYTAGWSGTKRGRAGI